MVGRIETKMISQLWHRVDMEGKPYHLICAIGETIYLAGVWLDEPSVEKQEAAANGLLVELGLD
jgi:hypothetical protein